MKRIMWGARLPIYVSLIFLLLSAACKLPAQKTGKEAIRSAYQEINARIETCEKEGSPCGLYLNRIQTNSGDEPWAAVGIYKSTRDLWYQRDESAEEESYQLIKVNTTTYRSARIENEEYLFSPEGNFLFYYFRVMQEEKAMQEFRYYFSGDKLIDYIERLEEGEAEYREWSKEDAENVRENAREWQKILKATL